MFIELTHCKLFLFLLLLNIWLLHVPFHTVHGVLKARILKWFAIPFSSPEYPLEGLILKLKLQYFGHLMVRPWCWEKLKVGEGGDRGWDGWVASPTQWTWVWASSGSWWWAGKSGVLQSMGSQSRTRLSDWTELRVPGFPGGASGKEPTCQCRRQKRHGFDPWVGKISWNRKWQATPVFSLENPMDRGGWQAAVHGVTKSRARWVTEHTCAACPALVSRFQYFPSRRAFFQMPFSNLLPFQEKAFSSPFPQNLLHSHPFKEDYCQYMQICPWFQNLGLTSLWGGYSSYTPA